MTYSKALSFTSLNSTEILTIAIGKIISYNFCSKIIIDSEEVAK